MKKLILILITVFLLVGCTNPEFIQKDEIVIQKIEEKAVEIAEEEKASLQYIGNKNTKKLHLPSCYTLPKEKNRVYFTRLEDAFEKNYVSCKKCCP